MRIAIVGSRNFPDPTMVSRYVYDNFCGDDSLVSGGADGVDSAAEAQARMLNIPITIFLPDWDKHGKKAGYLRNIQIVENADKVIAFWDGKSKGTKHTIDIARSRNVPLEIVEWKWPDPVPAEMVVNIKSGKHFDAYIGRAGQGREGYFGNPYEVGKDGTREQCIEYFSKWFTSRIRSDIEYRKRVDDLQGKVLGCFCKPAACHGDVLLDYLNNKNKYLE